jgi:hypothetical protein
MLKMQFDSLELQKNIEEKRLIYGYRFGNFLTKKTLKFGQFLRSIGASKYFAFYGCLAIFLVSILVRSTRDIGHDTGSYLEMGRKILAGGKYYHDFFEGNLPFALYLSAIPHILAKIFSIHLVIAAEIFYNFIGLVAVISSGLILRKSTLVDRRSFYNLVLFALSAGYFLRIFSLQFNEFGTKAGYLLLFAYPYIAYQFPRKNAITIIDKIVPGMLAGLIFCVKPHYFLLVLAFEIAKIFNKKSIKCLISLTNFTALIVIFGYLFLMLKYCPEYFEHLAALKSIYKVYQIPKLWLVSIFLIFVYNILPTLFLVILTFDLIGKDQHIKLLFIAFIGASLIALSESLNAYDQLSSFYSLSLPLMIVVIYSLFDQNKANFSKNWFLIFSIIIISQFDVLNFSELSTQLIVLWWVAFLLISFSWRKFFKNNLVELNSKKLHKIKNIILLNNVYLKAIFALLAIATIVLSTSSKYCKINYLLCVLIFSLVILASEKLHQNFITKNYYSRVAIIIITIVFSGYLGLTMASIFNHQNLYGHYFKSPNYGNSEIIKTINQYAKDDKNQPIIVAYGIYGMYPMLSYSNKHNPLPSHYLSPLENNISDSIKYNFNQKNDYKILKEGIFYGSGEDEIGVRKYLFDRLKMAMKIKNNNLLIIYKKHYDGYDDCRIGFLEYYLQDREFRKIFFKNYHFLNRVIYSKRNNSKNNAEFAKKGEMKDRNSEIMTKDSSNIIIDAEIYVGN